MLTNVEVFYGTATPQQAKLYVRLGREGIPADATLRGSVVGPECEFAATLPAKVVLRDLGAGDTLMASASIPDPVFWSGRLPARYRVRIELCVGEEVLAREERLVGMRALGVIGADFRQEGKRIVLRMIHRGEAPALEVEAWRENSASMFVVNPSEDLCEEASRLGVLLAVLVQGDADAVQLQLRKFARHACVAVAVVDGNQTTPSDQLRDAAPNIMLFQPVSPEETRWKLAPWAQGVMAPVINPTQFALAASQCEVPILAARPHGLTSDLAATRAACDVLQRDLAPYCQCAGYIV